MSLFWTIFGIATLVVALIMNASIDYTILGFLGVGIGQILFKLEKIEDTQ